MLTDTALVHQIRYSTKFISYKDLKMDLKDQTRRLILDLEAEWGKKYHPWRNNSSQLSTYFKYPSETETYIQRIPLYNRQKGNQMIFLRRCSVCSLYLTMMDATKKWTGKAWDRGLTPGSTILL